MPQADLKGEAQTSDPEQPSSGTLVKPKAQLQDGKTEKKEENSGGTEPTNDEIDTSSSPTFSPKSPDQTEDTENQGFHRVRLLSLKCGDALNREEGGCKGGIFQSAL